MAGFQENVRFFGRTYEEDGIRYFNWTASGFEFAFEGTRAEAELVTNQAGEEGKTAYLNVFVDVREEPADARTIKLDAPRKRYVLAEDLPYGKHTVKVIKRTGNLTGGSDPAKLSTKAGLVSLSIPGGKWLPAPAPKRRKLEFIGDSITVGAELGREPAPVPPDDGWKTYAAYAARALDADFHVLAISGNGVICSVFGEPLFELPDEFPWTDRYNKPGLRWDHAQYQPDVVVVNLGTNDLAGIGPGKRFTRRQFEDAYAAFLLEIKSKYPQAKVIGALGAMSEGKDDLFPQVEAALARANAQYGETFGYSLRLVDNVAEDGRAGDHPSEKAHIKHGKALVARIREITGWS